MHKKHKRFHKSKPRQSWFRLRIVLKILFVAVFIFSFWESWQFTKPKNFPINHVKVTATFEHIDPKFLQATIEPYLHNGFFYLNAFGLQHQLLKIPWIYTISVDRVWPDTLSINIIEQKAIAQWGENSLINAEGKIFSPAIETFPQNTPILFGQDSQVQNILKCYLEAKPLLAPLNLTITQLVFSPYHYWQITLNPDMTIFLREQNPIDQLKLLLNVYNKVTVGHNNPPKSIDLRYNNGLAVRW